MNKVVLSLVAGLAGLAVTPASSAPIGNLPGLSNDTVQVQHRRVCDQAGRCYRAANRNVRRQYIVKDYDYAPSYGYYGPRRSYGYAPGYSYGDPGYAYGAPGVGVGIGGFGIGIGPGW